MSEDLAALIERVASLEAERGRLLAEAAPLTKKERKEERATSIALANIEKRIAKVTARRARLNTQKKSYAPPVTASPRFLFRAALVSLLACPFPLVLSFAAAGEDVRWVETTCEERNVVFSDGDGDTVIVPALRPEWQIPYGKGGPCWIPVPETSRAIARFEQPGTARVSRWEQVGNEPRVASAALLLFAGAAAHLARRSRRNAGPSQQ